MINFVPTWGFFIHNGAAKYGTSRVSSLNYPTTFYEPFTAERLIKTSRSKPFKNYNPH
jgi:hypothetical protein